MLQCLKWKEAGLNFSRIALDVTGLSFLRPAGVIPIPNLTSHLKRATEMHPEIPTPSRTACGRGYTLAF